MLGGGLRILKVSFLIIIMKTTRTGYAQTEMKSSSFHQIDSVYDEKQVTPQPQFDDLNIKEIRAKTAQTVLLPCSVFNVGDKVVSWIKKKDLLIISSGMFTFSGDNRFEPVHTAFKNFWGLRIRGVKVSDSGQYECQVNTDPKMSLLINLTVSDREYNSGSLKADRRTTIKGSSQIHVHSGSPVLFTCEVTTTTSMRSSNNRIKRTKENTIINRRSNPIIRWFHNGFEVNFDSRDGISIENNSEDKRATSKLKLASVREEDAGDYVCTDGISNPAQVKLYVVDVEHSEAMQRDYPHSSSASTFVNVFRIILILSFVMIR